MRALVIDDSSAIRLVMGRMLGDLGVETAQAVDGQDGLDNLGRQTRYDVVFVDWNMPRMNGIEFIRSVRSRDQFKRLPIIMVTTENEIEKVQTALEAGADEFLMKPCTKSMISEKLDLLGLSCEA